MNLAQAQTSTRLVVLGAHRDIMRKGACNSVYGEIQTWLPILFLAILI